MKNSDALYCDNCRQECELKVLKNDKDDVIVIASACCFDLVVLPNGKVATESDYMQRNYDL